MRKYQFARPMRCPSKVILDRAAVMRELNAWGFALFALKGIAWLLLSLMAIYFA